MSELERRFFTIQNLRMADGEGEQRTIHGYAAVFDSLSQVLWGFREKIAPGAFAETLGDDIRALWNHDTGRVLGRTKANTLRLEEDAIGLRIEIDPPSSAEAEIESIDRGDVDQMSFGFRTLEDSWDQDDEGQIIRTLRKVKLFEVSPVTFPAYSATSVSVRELPRSGDGAGYLSDTFGFIPEVPAELRGASDSAMTVEQRARARVAQRNRHLQLIS